MRKYLLDRTKKFYNLLKINIGGLLITKEENMFKNNFNSNILLILIIFFAIIGCTASVNYVGEEYEPTTSVDVYFSEDEIEKEYTIMGHAIGSGGDLISNEDIQNKLVEVAKSKGADAIVITGLGKSNIPVGEWGESEKQIKTLFLKYK